MGLRYEIIANIRLAKTRFAVCTRGIHKEQIRDTTWPATPQGSLSIIPIHCFVTGRS